MTVDHCRNGWPDCCWTAPQRSNLQKTDRKRPSARQLLELTGSLSVPRQERVELVLIDARFVVSGCLEALQICTTARASSSTSHLTVQEPPASIRQVVVKVPPLVRGLVHAPEYISFIWSHLFYLDYISTHLDLDYTHRAFRLI